MSVGWAVGKGEALGEEWLPPAQDTDSPYVGVNPVAPVWTDDSYYTGANPVQPPTGSLATLPPDEELAPRDSGWTPAPVSAPKPVYQQQTAGLPIPGTGIVENNEPVVRDLAPKPWGEVLQEAVTKPFEPTPQDVQHQGELGFVGDVVQGLNRGLRGAKDLATNPAGVAGRVYDAQMPGTGLPLGEIASGFTPMGPIGGMAKAGEYAPTFFSKLAKVVSSKMGRTAPADQVIRMLKANGVKDAELYWTGVDSMLEDAARAGRAVTQQEILDAVDDAGIEVIDNMFERGATRPVRWEFNPNNQTVRDVTTETTMRAGGTEGHFVVYSPAYEKTLRDDGAYIDELTWGKASDGRRLFPGEVEFDNYPAAKAYAEEQAELFNRQNPSSMEPEKYYSKYTLPEGGNYRELLLTLPRHVRARAGGEQFKYHNFPEEPDIVAHVRTTDRTAPDGSKMLFIEELQSDLHQQGRKKGYTPDYKYEPWRTEEEAAKLPGAPPTPWEKNWDELGFRRMLRYAAENGYDYVSWAPSPVQRLRYFDREVPNANDYVSTYDRSLVQHANRIGKPFGTQVEFVPQETGAPTHKAAKYWENRWRDLKDPDVVYIGADGRSSVLDPNTGKAKKFSSPEEAHTYVQEQIEIVTENIRQNARDYDASKVHPVLKITPEMKHSVLYEGQPQMPLIPAQTQDQEEDKRVGRGAAEDDFGQSGGWTPAPVSGSPWVDETSYTGANPVEPVWEDESSYTGANPVQTFEPTTGKPVQQYTPPRANARISSSYVPPSDEELLRPNVNTSRRPWSATDDDPIMGLAPLHRPVPQKVRDDEETAKEGTGWWVDRGRQLEGLNPYSEHANPEYRRSVNRVLADQGLPQISSPGYQPPDSNKPFEIVTNPGYGLEDPQLDFVQDGKSFQPDYKGGVYPIRSSEGHQGGDPFAYNDAVKQGIKGATQLITDTLGIGEPLYGDTRLSDFIADNVAPMEAMAGYGIGSGIAKVGGFVAKNVWKGVSSIAPELAATAAQSGRLVLTPGGVAVLGGLGTLAMGAEGTDERNARAATMLPLAIAALTGSSIARAQGRNMIRGAVAGTVLGSSGLLGAQAAGVPIWTPTAEDISRAALGSVVSASAAKGVALAAAMPLIANSLDYLAGSRFAQAVRVAAGGARELQAIGAPIGIQWAEKGGSALASITYAPNVVLPIGISLGAATGYGFPGVIPGSGWAMENPQNPTPRDRIMGAVIGGLVVGGAGYGLSRLGKSWGEALSQAGRAGFEVPWAQTAKTLKAQGYSDDYIARVGNMRTAREIEAGIPTGDVPDYLYPGGRFGLAWDTFFRKKWTDSNAYLETLQAAAEKAGTPLSDANAFYILTRVSAGHNEAYKRALSELQPMFKEAGLDLQSGKNLKAYNEFIQFYETWQRSKLFYKKELRSGAQVQAQKKNTSSGPGTGDPLMDYAAYMEHRRFTDDTWGAGTSDKWMKFHEQFSQWGHEGVKLPDGTESGGILAYAQKAGLISPRTLASILEQHPTYSSFRTIAGRTGINAPHAQNPILATDDVIEHQTGGARYTLTDLESTISYLLDIKRAADQNIIARGLVAEAERNPDGAMGSMLIPIRPALKQAQAVLDSADKRLARIQKMLAANPTSARLQAVIAKRQAEQADALTRLQTLDPASRGPIPGGNPAVFNQYTAMQGTGPVVMRPGPVEGMPPHGVPNTQVHLPGQPPLRGEAEPQTVLGVTRDRSGKPFWDQKDPPKGWGTFKVYQNGVEREYIAPTWFADYLYGATPVQADVVSSMMSKLMYPFKLGITSLNPVFAGFRNPQIDTQEAMLNTGYTRMQDVKNYLSVVSALLQEKEFTKVRDFYPAMMLGSAGFATGLGPLDARSSDNSWERGSPPGLDERLRGAAVGAAAGFTLSAAARSANIWAGVERVLGLDRKAAAGAVDEFLKQGGRSGTIFESVRPGHSRHMMEALGVDTRNTAEKAWGVISSPLELIRANAELLELATRATVYKSSRDRGVSEVRSAYAGRSATIDFSKAGDTMKIINMWAPLLNARVQGTLRTAQAVRDDPLGFVQRTAALSTLPTIALALYNREQWGDVYNKIPMRERDHYWNFIVGTYDTGGTGDKRPIYIKIPKTMPEIMYASPLEHMLNTYLNETYKGQPLSPEHRNERSLAETVTAAVMSISPIQPQEHTDANASDWIYAAAISANPITSWAAQVVGNRNDFLGEPLIPPGQQSLPKDYQFGNRIRPGASWITRQLRAGGLPEHLVPAPATVEMTARTFGGTLGDLFLGAVDQLVEATGMSAMRPTSLDQLKIPEDRLRNQPGGRVAGWQRYLDTLDQPNTAPQWSRFLAGIVGRAGGQQTIEAKVKNMGQQDQQRYEQTRNYFGDGDDYTTYQYLPKLRDIHNNPDLSHGQKSAAIRKADDARREYFVGLKGKYELAITDPVAREEFKSRMPGIPVTTNDIQVLAGIPEGVDLATLKARYYQPRPPQEMEVLSPALQQRLRDQELSRIARESDVPPGVLLDAFNWDTNKGVMPLAGVPSVWIDDAVTRWLSPGTMERDANGKAVAGQSKLLNPDGTSKTREEIASIRKTELQEIAKQYGVPPEDVMARIDLRLSRSGLGNDPLTQSYRNALKISRDIDDVDKHPLYYDAAWQPIPADAATQAYWDRQLATKTKGEILKLPPGDPTRMNWEARQRGELMKRKAMWDDPNYRDYNRWFGLGESMTDKQWNEYVGGGTIETAPRYKVGGPADWNSFDQFRQAYQLLPPGPQKMSLRAAYIRTTKAMNPKWQAKMRAIADNSVLFVGEEDD